MKKIRLPNRDGANLQLVNVTKNLWKLESDKDYVLKYIRVIFKEHATDYSSENIEAVDPPGGPMLYLGDIIDGYKIEGFHDFMTLILSNERDNDSQEHSA